MKAIAPVASLALLFALGACSSTPTTQERVLSAQPVTSAPFELTTTDRGQVLTLQDVLFDFEDANLRPEASDIIEKAARFMKDNRSRVAVVEGHTDTTGLAGYNVSLSMARARSVREALVARGVPANRIKAEGFGETRPVATNVTRNGRQQNRRVEIVFQDADNATFTQL